MNLAKNQYKDSEIGVIPVGWEVASLEDVTIKVGSGITPTGGEKVYKSEGRVFLRSQNIGHGKLLLDDVAYINDETHYAFQSTEIHDKDVFLNITGASIGRSAVANTSVIYGNVNQHVCIIRTNQNYLDPHYLNYFLLSQSGQKQIDSYQAGGNRQGLNFGQIKSFRIPIPIISEQTAIATALSDTDALIENLEKLIAKKRNIKQGVMQELLTGRKRLTGFNGKLVEIKLGDVAEVLKGKGLSKTKLQPEGEKPCILYGELFTTYNRIIYNVKSKTNIEEGELSKAGDVLMPGSTTTIGIDLAIASTILQNNVLLGGDIIIIRPINKYIDSIFLSYYLTEVMKYKISELTQGITIIHLYGKDLRTLRITLPPIEEQSAIANFFKEIDTEIELLQKKLTKYRMIKQGMMQVLLTGKIRLNH